MSAMRSLEALLYVALIVMIGGLRNHCVTGDFEQLLSSKPSTRNRLPGHDQMTPLRADIDWSPGAAKARLAFAP